ncbi:hypothetical protein TRFO_17992 [Tritrichomonas foetus]|uniref:Transmembrane protein n=1 Tax=Tritrichomonas foetus TaxID=1144522 RepID=A0A1J4KRK0_9EUKA|nr:hypothetical protein TRFO_17992 [Tritrichomonas foetus]|eukprot:OHT12294.1 hypothetical protein TRFO_17992 [Tritrichomonas foetus]
MDSETSENTDAISADLIANVFSSLSSPVPPNLTNYEFNIFHFYSSLIQGTRQMIPFSIIMNIILIFQSFATNSLLILLDNIERNGENISNTFQFVYFFLNFNVYSSSDGFSPSYFLAIALAAFLCIIIFFFALYLAATKTYLRIRMQCFFVFFIIEVPSILLIVMANVTSRLICHLLAQTYKKYIFQSIILVIFFILLFVMYQFTALTLHNSVYYQMGAKISVPTISFHVLYTLMALIVNIMNTTLPPPRTKIFLSIFYGIIGVYQVFLSTLRFYQYDLLSGFSLGSAFSLFHSCIYYSLRAANYELDPELFLYINFIIFFGVSIISNFVIKLSNKSIVKKLNRDPDFFVTKRLKQTNNESESGESLKSLDTFESVDIDDQENDEIITHNKKSKNSKNTTENNSKSKGKKDSHDDRTLESYQNNRISDYKLALYAKIAFMEALPCAFNLSFLDQAIEYPRPNWLLFQFLRYATLINSQDEKTCQLVSIIESIPNLSISERFIVWEMEYFTNANIIDDPPESLKPAILELETKIIQFQTANKSFTAKISDDATVNSLLIDALSSMKNLITNEMRLMKWMLPNCPQVLQLYSTYKSKVCDTEKSSKNWNTIASELKKNSIIFADFNHVHAYDIFPKMQSSLLQMLTKNRAFNTSIGRQITMNPYAQKLPPITQSRQDSRQTLAAIFSNRLTVYSTISKISFFLLFVILMVHFLLCFTQNSYNKRYYSDFFELSVCFLDTASAYISFLVPAQALIRNGNNSTISDFDYTNIKANEFAVLSSSLSSLFKMKSFTRKSIFKESFAWFPKKIFQLPSINVHYTMNEEITITLSRLTTLYNSIVQDTTINFDAPELPTFIVTSKIFPQFWIQALDLTRNSVITLLDKIKTTINNKMYYSSIPFIIVLVFCCFLPIFILYEMRQLIPLFPHDKSK